MADITLWNATDASNASVANGWPSDTSMPAGDVDDSGRAMMGAIRRLADEIPWFATASGDAYTAGTSTTFTGPSSASGTYEIGRRVRVTDSGTVYGTITAYDAGTGLITIVDDAVATGGLTGAISAVELGLHVEATTPYINGLPTISSIAEDDVLPVWDTSAAAARGITAANFRHVIQTVRTASATYHGASGAAIPLDDTIPTSAEGEAISQFDVSITPVATNNRLEYSANIVASTADAAGTIIFALFVAGATDADAVFPHHYNNTAAGEVMTHTLNYVATATSTGATTFALRVGRNAAGEDIFINGNQTTRLFGGVMGSNVIVTEKSPS
jgi:hypothetical protein